MTYKLLCSKENAESMLKWINNRGGVAVWRSVNLSNPGASWSTPATIRLGDCEGYDSSDDTIALHPKPTWQAEDTPTIITDASGIGVEGVQEVKRFRVGLRRSSFAFKCTDGGSNRIRREVDKAGEGASFVFDYDTQEAVILRPTSITALSTYGKELS